MLNIDAIQAAILIINKIFTMAFRFTNLEMAG